MLIEKTNTRLTQIVNDQLSLDPSSLHQEKTNLQLTIIINEQLSFDPSLLYGEKTNAVLTRDVSTLWGL